MKNIFYPLVVEDNPVKGDNLVKEGNLVEEDTPTKEDILVVKLGIIEHRD